MGWPTSFQCKKGKKYIDESVWLENEESHSKSYYIYLLESDDRQYFKIGISSNPRTRCHCLNRDILESRKVSHIFRVIDEIWIGSEKEARGYESALLTYFEDCKVYHWAVFPGATEVILHNDKSAVVDAFGKIRRLKKTSS